MKFFIHSLLMFAFWLILSGMYDAFHVGLGIFSIVCILLFYRKLFLHRESFCDGLAGTGFSYVNLGIFLVYLFFQVLKSAFQVARLLLHSNDSLHPAVFTFKTSLPTLNAQVLLANSITLTPGTVTMELEEDGTFIVHCLSSDPKHPQMDHGLARALAKVYGMPADKVIIEEGLYFKK